MGSVILEMSMSLDGFVAGPNVREQEPMGDQGEWLHEWMFADKTAQEAQDFQEQSFQPIGALIIGRRTFDLGVGPWGDNPTFHTPCFVVSNRAHEKIVKQGGTSYTFITAGIVSALQQAKAAAGDKHVRVLGGATIGQEYLNAGLIDELSIHLVPVLLGQGTRLFEHLDAAPIALERLTVEEDKGVTHLRFRVVNEAGPEARSRTE